MTNETSPELADAPKLDTVRITPEMAVEILNRRNTHNRQVRRSHVEKLARDMVSGKWRVNGEAIKVAKDGTVLDGQHRLLAVAASGVAIWTVYVADLDPDTQYTMDANLKRSNGDHFRLIGESDAFALAAILRAAWQWDNGDQGFSTHIHPTQSDLAVFLTANPGMRRSVEVAGRAYRDFRFLSKTAYGVAHHIISQVDEHDEHWPEFFARLGDGAEVSTGNPIHTMRKRTMSDRDERNRKRLTLGNQIGYITYTWNRWRDYVETGKTLLKFAYNSADGVPLPVKPLQVRQGELDSD
jgi:hypothetical protein